MIRRGLAMGEGVLNRMGARAQFFVSGLMFGLMGVMARRASLGGFSGAQTAVIRFAVGAGLTLGLFAARPGTFAPVKRWLLFSRGVTGGLAAFLYFLALARIPAGEASLLNGLWPIFGIIFSYFTLRERPTVHLAVGLVVAGMGVFLVLGGGGASFSLGWGELAGVASAIMGGAAVTAVRALRATDNAPTIFLAFCLGGLVVSIPFATGGWPQDPTVWILALSVGVLSFGGQLLMTQSLGSLTVPEAAIWQQLTPVSSYLWAPLVLGEALSVSGILGVGLGISGVAYGSILGRARQVGPAGEAEGPPPV
jgi:drug/metabolite transporter (DMT)-like permease